MTCREVESLILPYARAAEIPPEAAAHIAGCASCGGLARMLAKRDAAAGPSPAGLARIKAEIAGGLKPVKPLAPASVLAGAYLLIAALGAAAGVFELGTAGWHALGGTQASAVFLALAVSSVALAVLLARQMAPGSRVLVPAPWIVLGFPVVMGAIFATLFRAQPEALFVATGLTCLRIGLECALPVAAVCWLVLRRGAVLGERTAGALAGALAGLSGLLLLEIFCPNLNAYHVLAWHLGAAVVSTAAGMAAGMAAGRIGR